MSDGDVSFKVQKTTNLQFTHDMYIPIQFVRPKLTIYLLILCSQLFPLGFKLKY